MGALNCTVILACRIPAALIHVVLLVVGLAGADDYGVVCEEHGVIDGFVVGFGKYVQ